MLSKLPIEKQIETKEMDQEVLFLSKYLSTLLANQIGTILIIIVLTTSIILNRESTRAFYALVVNALLPLFLCHVFRPQKEQKPFLLPLLAKKYNYQYSKYQAYSISFLLECFLLFLWNRRESENILTRDFLSFAPFFILLIMVSIRIIGILYYKRKLHHMLLFSRY